MRRGIAEARRQCRQRSRAPSSRGRRSSAASSRSEQAGRCTRPTRTHRASRRPRATSRCPRAGPGSRAALLHVDDQLMHRVAQRAHQHGGRHEDQGDAEEDQDRRGQSLLSSHLVRKVLVQRIERDRKNHRPDHQRQERREDPVAKHDQRQDEAGTDEHVQQPGCVASPQFAIKPVCKLNATPTANRRAGTRKDGALAWIGNAAPVCRSGQRAQALWPVAAGGQAAAVALRRGSQFRSPSL